MPSMAVRSQRFQPLNIHEMFMTEPCKQLTIDEFNFYQNALLIISTFNPMSERYHIHYNLFFRGG